MSNFLGFILSFVFMMYFSWQPMMDEINGAKLQTIQNSVDVALEQAKIKGYFSQDDITRIQSITAQRLGYPVGLVTVTGTMTPQTRGSGITLSISAPSSLVLINLGPLNNVVILKKSSTAASEPLQS